MSERWPPIPPIWRGETAFVIGGGPSFADVDVERLRCCRIVAINCSWARVPWADVLFFGDDRFWRHYKTKVLAGFHGRILTTASSASDPRVSRLKNALGPRIYGRPKPAMLLSENPAAVPMRRTSLIPGINIAALLIGMEGRIVLLGADGRRAKDGRSHHHAPHPWPVRPGCWDVQVRDLAELAPQLAAKKIEVLNASPGSAWDVWPIVRLDDVLPKSERAA